MLNSNSSTSPIGRGGNTDLPAEITRLASKQTYYTFRLLVEHDHIQDAFRAYAYFRWVDDQLDCNASQPQEKLTFLNRQQALMEACYRKESPSTVSPEEQMLVDMIASDHEESSGLQSYLRNMMAVMSFDVQRKGRVITLAELTQYSHLLSIAVTELLFYFIGHDDPAPRSTARYQAVLGAHIAHMLRDMLDDIDLGYINVPAETLEKGLVSIEDLNSQSFRMWVLQRVTLAHRCFNLGKKYFARVKSLRCRLAAYAYLARFEWILRAIERDGYRLRRAYPERKSLRAGVWMAWKVMLSMFTQFAKDLPDGQIVLSEQLEDE